MKNTIHIAARNTHNDGKGGDTMYGNAICGAGYKEAELIYHRANCRKCKMKVLEELKKELKFWWADELEVKLK